MNKTEAVKLLPQEQLIMCDWDVAVLGEVLTLAEACYMWKLSRGALKNAVLTKKLEARRSFTGGDWLITVTSMITVYGQPKEDVLSCLKNN